MNQHEYDIFPIQSRYMSENALDLYDKYCPLYDIYVAVCYPLEIEILFG